jgi:hypothetical protein
VLFDSSIVSRSRIKSAPAAIGSWKSCRVLDTSINKFMTEPPTSLRIDKGFIYRLGKRPCSVSLRDLHKVAAGVLEDCGCHRTHRDWRLSEIDPQL